MQQNEDYKNMMNDQLAITDLFTDLIQNHKNGTISNEQMEDVKRCYMRNQLNSLSFATLAAGGSYLGVSQAVKHFASDSFKAGRIGRFTAPMCSFFAFFLTSASTSSATVVCGSRYLENKNSPLSRDALKKFYNTSPNGTIIRDIKRRMGIDTFNEIVNADSSMGTTGTTSGGAGLQSQQSCSTNDQFDTEVEKERHSVKDESQLISENKINYDNDDSIRGYFETKSYATDSKFLLTDTQSANSSIRSSPGTDTPITDSRKITDGIRFHSLSPYEPLEPLDPLEPLEPLESYPMCDKEGYEDDNNNEQKKQPTAGSNGSNAEVPFRTTWEEIRRRQH